jgi:uncharacterized RDD family membrane protein YckC
MTYQPPSADTPAPGGSHHQHEDYWTPVPPDQYRHTQSEVDPGTPVAPPTGYQPYVHPTNPYVPPCQRPPQLASMGARLGGHIIDSILVGVVAGIVSAVLTALQPSSPCNSQGSCAANTSVLHVWQGNIIFLVIAALYSAYFVGVTSQSLGHRVVGIRIVNVDTGAPIGAGWGALRWLVLVVTGLLCTLGYWSPYFDARRRGWHDQATNAIAITAR